MSDEQKEKPQKRVLVLADFACATGFAQVSQNIVAEVLKDETIDYFIDVVGINYYGLPNEWQSISPRVRIFPASHISQGDLFGRRGFLEMLSTGAYDIAWILQDTFNIESISDQILEIRTKLITNGKKPFKYIFYFPIDAKPKENWVTKAVSKADIPVVYTKYGYDECIKFDEGLKDKLLIVPHGIDINIFHPVPDEEKVKFRKDYFVDKVKPDDFLVLNVNRNQPRKDIARTMAIFAKFKQQVPEAKLYLHMKADDVAYNLHEVARNYDLIPDEDYILPKHFDEHDGLSPQMINYIYNAANCVISTSMGEGWGLSITEAIACKIPVVAPRHTSIAEILSDNRGTLVSAGKTQNDWLVMGADNERLRPLVDINEFVEKLVWVRNNQATAKEMAENAYQFLTNNWTWTKVGQTWREIFKTAVPTQKLVKTGRNDDCPCGSGKKFKRCHGL